MSSESKFVQAIASLSSSSFFLSLSFTSSLPFSSSVSSSCLSCCQAKKAFLSISLFLSLLGFYLNIFFFFFCHRTYCCFYSPLCLDPIRLFRVFFQFLVYSRKKEVVSKQAKINWKKEDMPGIPETFQLKRELGIKDIMLDPLPMATQQLPSILYFLFKLLPTVMKVYLVLSTPHFSNLWYNFLHTISINQFNSSVW